MPRGSGSSARRAELRAASSSTPASRSSLQAALANLASSPAARPIPTCPGPEALHCCDVGSFRIDVGAIRELGAFNSAARAQTVENLVVAILSELWPWVTGVQFLPGSQQRDISSPACHLLLFFGSSPEACTAWIELSRHNRLDFSVLPSGLIAPLSAVSTAMFCALPPSLYPRRSLPLPPLPVPTQAEADARKPVTTYLRLNWGALPPNAVTVKIRGLSPSMQRMGVTSAFLVASGYPPSSFSVHLEYYPPFTVHGQPYPSLLGGFRDYSTVFATVFGPPHDPMLAQASRKWLLPGHSHPVRVSVVPSQARVVTGTPICTPPPPMHLHPQRPALSPVQPSAPALPAQRPLPMRPTPAPAPAAPPPPPASPSAAALAPRRLSLHADAPTSARGDVAPAAPSETAAGAATAGAAPSAVTELEDMLAACGVDDCDFPYDDDDFLSDDGDGGFDRFAWGGFNY